MCIITEILPGTVTRTARTVQVVEIQHQHAKNLNMLSMSKFVQELCNYAHVELKSMGKLPITILC